MIPILVLLGAYLLGAIPFGYVLVKWKTGADVRSAGSGNIGATNVLRTTGRAAGIATLLFDVAKGYLAVWLAARHPHRQVPLGDVEQERRNARGASRGAQHVGGANIAAPGRAHVGAGLPFD
jgi:hypothetical protein